MTEVDITTTTDQLVDYSTTAIKHMISTNLRNPSAKIPGTMDRTECRVVVRINYTIDEYESIVNMCLNEQIGLVFDKFYEHHRELCINIIDRVYAFVKDKSPVDEEVINWRDEYVTNRTNKDTDLVDLSEQEVQTSEQVMNDTP